VSKKNLAVLVRILSVEFEIRMQAVTVFAQLGRQLVRSVFSTATTCSPAMLMSILSSDIRANAFKIHSVRSSKDGLPNCSPSSELHLAASNNLCM